MIHLLDASQPAGDLHIQPRKPAKWSLIQPSHKFYTLFEFKRMEDTDQISSLHVK
jgi:hypothetical protein